MYVKLFILNTTSQLLSPFKADLQDNNFVFILLVFIISLSLISQFYSKASPVHKVIALLLLSVLAVFLWTHETQFLFIYLVYILAFVGAVLILFLSVVLILPISTTNSVSSFMLLVSGVQPYNKCDLVSLRPASLSSPSNYSIVDSILSHKLSIILLFIIFIFIYHAILKFVDDIMIFDKSNFKVWLEQFSFVLTARCSGENLTSFFSHNVVVTNPLLKVWGQTDLNSDTPFRFLNQESKLLALLSQFSKGFASILERVLNQLAVIGTIIYGFFRYAVYTSAYQLTFGLLSKGSYSVISNLFTKHLTECLVSFYLAINLFILVVPSTASSLAEGFLFDTNFSGLSELRSLLYDNFGWFLLLSTIVLLVALLGVAVMTRNKK